MFSVPSTALRLELPIPPIPTQAMFNLSVGAVYPWLLPKIELGATVKAAAAAALLCRKFLLEMLVIVMMFFFMLVLM
jgi:hypothetical protein